MNEVLSDTDNPSHLHLDLESNIFFLQKTYLPTYSLLNAMAKISLPSLSEKKGAGVNMLPAGSCDLPWVTPDREEITQQPLATRDHFHLH